MKVIFIVLDFGLAIRNILKNRLFDILKSHKDLKIVVFSPIADEAFKKEYGGDNVVIELNPKHKNILTKTIYSMGKYIWEKKTKIFSFEDKRAGKKHGAKTIFLKIVNTVVGDYSRVLSAIERVTLYLFRNRQARNYFEKYRPDIVFYTTMYARDPCLEIEAQKQGIKTICFIHSWDNPTTKGPFRMTPDKIIVWNNILKEEVIKYHDYPEENIYISGIPQFDIYHDKSRFASKEEFFKRYDLDLSKKLLTYATSTRGPVPFSPEIVDILYSAIKENAFVYPCQLLIRIHPRDNVERYRKFKGIKGITMQTAGRQADISDRWHPTEDDMLKLAETMYYSDVVINITSTITVDAIALDTPVIGIAFDGYQTKPYEQSCRRYYSYDHYKNIVKAGGIKIAYSKEDLIEHINAYLRDPSLDAEGRKRVREEQCWKLDGNAGERIAEYILQYLKEEKT